MSHLSSTSLFIILGLLIALSAFFSSSETGLMTLNRYRLKHLVKEGHRGAKRAQKLLDRPDRLLGLILLCNNFVNILASAIATILSLRHFGETGIALATGLLTFVILIFAEVAPKTLASLHPERIAFPAAFVYTPLLKAIYPLVFIVNFIANSLLRLIGVNPEKNNNEGISTEELRSVVMENNKRLPQKHRKMLLGLLNLERSTIDDIMVPRNEITALDLNESWEDIIKDLTTCQRARLPVYRDDINNIQGILHMRSIVMLLSQDELTKDSLQQQIREAYFIPEGTSLYQQLTNFQKNKRRTALAVDEYGDIQGLVTLEDILEEIVGEFTTDSPINNNHIVENNDGSYLISANTHIREINRSLKIALPTKGAKTLNGLILEHLQSIPTTGTTLLIANHPIEVIKVQNNLVQMARLKPRINLNTNDEDTHQEDTESDGED